MDADDESEKPREPTTRTLPSKRDLKAELTRALEAELAAMEGSYKAAREAATHEEAKPENDKDTRALEQSYIARGQALRINEMRIGLTEVSAMPAEPFRASSPAAMGALIEIDDDGRPRVVFLAPAGGGMTLASSTVQVVTTKSPLGRTLLGKRAGDFCEARVGDRTRELEVLAVR